MQIGKRYIFVGADGNTFTGIIVRVTDKTITYKHKSDDNYQNTTGKYGEGTYHIPRELIVKSFLMDELIPGQRYNFKFTPTTDKEINPGPEGADLNLQWCKDKEFTHVFISISGNYEMVYCYETGQGRSAFPLYWIKDISSEQ
jgi:hypothetical protein